MTTTRHPVLQTPLRVERTPMTQQDVSSVRPITDAEHLEAINTLRERSYELKFVIGRLPTTRRAGTTKSAEIARFMGGSSKGIRTSWKLFSDKHPAVKELNGLLNDLASYRDSFAAVEDSRRSNDPDSASKEGGKRLIWAADHREIYDQICVKADRVRAAALKVEDALAEIKAQDRELAGALWQEEAYPANLASIIGVPKDSSGNYIIEFAPTVSIPKGLDHKIEKHLMDRVAEKLSGSIEVAVGSAVKKLNDGISTFLSELVNRTKISPLPAHPFAKYCTIEDAVVNKIKTAEQDRKLPPNTVLLNISYLRKAATEDEELVANEDGNVRIVEWAGPIDKDEYEKSVRPRVTQEKKKIYPTVIEGILNDMNSFRDQQSRLLGQHGRNVDAAFTNLFDTLNRLRRLDGSNAETAERVAKQLKTDPMFKTSLTEAVEATVEALGNAVHETKAARRRIRVGALGDIND